MFRVKECEVVYRRRDVDAPGANKRIVSSETVYQIMRPIAAERAHESMWVLLLDARHQLIGIHEALRGNTATCALDMCSLFRAAVVTNARAMVLVHNHPSGEPDPSREDIELTKRVCEAAELLDLCVMDHVIVATSGFVSMLDSGLMPEVKRHG